MPQTLRNTKAILRFWLHLLPPTKVLAANTFFGGHRLGEHFATIS